MTKDKKGNLLDLGIPFLTLFMAGTVLFMHAASVAPLNASLVSPFEVLEISDDAEVFERAELASLKELYCEDKTTATLLSRYCSSFLSLEGVSLLTQNSSLIEGKEFSKSLCNSIYTVSGDQSSTTVTRSGLVRNKKLFSDHGRINFNMQMNYYLNRKITLSSDDCKNE